MANRIIAHEIESEDDIFFGSDEDSEHDVKEEYQKESINFQSTPSIRLKEEYAVKSEGLSVTIPQIKNLPDPKKMPEDIRLKNKRNNNRKHPILPPIKKIFYGLGDCKPIDPPSKPSKLDKGNVNLRALGIKPNIYANAAYLGLVCSGLSSFVVKAKQDSPMYRYTIDLINERKDRFAMYVDETPEQIYDNMKLYIKKKLKWTEAVNQKIFSITNSEELHNFLFPEKGDSDYVKLRKELLREMFDFFFDSDCFYEWINQGRMKDANKEFYLKNKGEMYRKFKDPLGYRCKFKYPEIKKKETMYNKYESVAKFIIFKRNFRAMICHGFAKSIVNCDKENQLYLFMKELVAQRLHRFNEDDGKDVDEIVEALRNFVAQTLYPGPESIPQNYLIAEKEQLAEYFMPQQDEDEFACLRKEILREIMNFFFNFDRFDLWIVSEPFDEVVRRYLKNNKKEIQKHFQYPLAYTPKLERRLDDPALRNEEALVEEEEEDELFMVPERRVPHFSQDQQDEGQEYEQIIQARKRDVTFDKIVKPGDAEIPVLDDSKDIIFSIYDNYIGLLSHGFAMAIFNPEMNVPINHFMLDLVRQQFHRFPESEGSTPEKVFEDLRAYIHSEVCVRKEESNWGIGDEEDLDEFLIVKPDEDDLNTVRKEIIQQLFDFFFTHECYDQWLLKVKIYPQNKQFLIYNREELHKKFQNPLFYVPKFDFNCEKKIPENVQQMIESSEILKAKPRRYHKGASMYIGLITDGFARIVVNSPIDNPLLKYTAELITTKKQTLPILAHLKVENLVEDLRYYISRKIWGKEYIQYTSEKRSKIGTKDDLYLLFIPQKGDSELQAVRKEIIKEMLNFYFDSECYEESLVNGQINDDVKEFLLTNKKEIHKKFQNPLLYVPRFVH